MTLMEIFEKMGRPTDKGTCHNYIEIYNKELNKKNKVNLLEIGMFTGILYCGITHIRHHQSASEHHRHAS
jgi:hypothetical protein